MTLQEVRDEYKQMEGDPKVKGRIKALRNERSRRRMMANVPRATVVITNPTHFAVALKYDRSMSAPQCLAKGADDVALRILETRRDGAVDGDHPPPARVMWSDKKKIAKILASLLSNAYKFTHAGEVRVELEVLEDRVIYSVQDTGIGIPADAQRYVFDEFRQVDGSMTRRYGGSGLGLALARRLARLLGGDIVLVSTPSVGSTFRVEVPLAYEPSEEPSPQLSSL